MFSYEGGLALALLLWLIGNINVIISINSRLEKNLNRFGQRLSWLTLTPKPMKAEDANRSTVSSVIKFILIAAIGIPFTLLSWLHVALYVGTFVYKRMKDAGAPQTVREFRWKLRNTEMSFDQIVKETMKVAEQDPANFEKFRSDLVQELESRGLSVS